MLSRQMEAKNGRRIVIYGFFRCSDSFISCFEFFALLYSFLTSLKLVSNDMITASLGNDHEKVVSINERKRK